MRTSILGFVGVLAFALGGAATADAQQPKRGGTLQFAISAETPHYDCHGSDTYATLHFGAPFYSTLLRFNLSNSRGGGRPRAILDGRARPDDLYIQLHPGVKFHDGTPLTSADIKATYDRLRNPPPGVVSTRMATFGDIGTIETPDANTVVFKMKAVNAAMIEHFASPWDCIYVRPRTRRRSQRAQDQDNGTGPVQVRRARQGESHCVGERFDHYFKQGPALSRRLPEHLDAAGGRQLNALQGGQVWPSSAASPRPSATGWCRRWRQIRIEKSTWIAQSGGRLQHREASRSTTCACARRCRSRSTAGAAPTRSPDLDAAVCRRPAAPRLDLRDAAKTSWSSSRLGAGDSPHSRAEAKGLLAEAGVKDLKFTLTIATLRCHTRRPACF